MHALKAIRDSLPAESALTAQNCSFGYLSKGKAFEVVEEEEKIQSFLDKLPAVVSRSVDPVEEAEIVEPIEEVSGATEMDVDPTNHEE